MGIKLLDKNGLENTGVWMTAHKAMEYVDKGQVKGVYNNNGQLTAIQKI